MLIDHEQAWTQKELIATTGLAQPTVSRALSRLSELGLVQRGEDRTYRVSSPADLLDAWSDEYDYQRQDVVPIHLTGAGIGLSRHVAEVLLGANMGCALTALPAAWLYDGFAQFRLGSCYVDGDPLEATERLGARIGEPGANFHLIRPSDEGALYAIEVVDDVPCVHPVQVYLDLIGQPERAAEAAQHLRQEWLGY